MTAMAKNKKKAWFRTKEKQDNYVFLKITYYKGIDSYIVWDEHQGAFCQSIIKGPLSMWLPDVVTLVIVTSSQSQVPQYPEYPQSPSSDDDVEEQGEFSQFQLEALEAHNNYRFTKNLKIY